MVPIFGAVKFLARISLFGGMITHAVCYQFLHLSCLSSGKTITKPVAMARVYGCCYKWNEACALLGIFFEKSSNEDLRSKQCFRLDLSDESESMKKWRDAIVINLGMNIKNVNLKEVTVARHHWSLAQLRFFMTIATNECRLQWNIRMRIRWHMWWINDAVSREGSKRITKTFQTTPLL